ncbi:hypothetical protein EV673_0382 [Limnobacter thiooxidans]|nr:hypothetical protein EV673_0382 [Limnobacter thiooxidans]
MMQVPTSKKDELTKKEILIYGVLHKMGVIWTLGALCWYFFVFKSELSLFGVLFLVFPCILVMVFGWSLRFDTRVMRRIS